MSEMNLHNKSEEGKVEELVIANVQFTEVERDVKEVAGNVETRQEHEGWNRGINVGEEASINKKKVKSTKKKENTHYNKRSKASIYLKLHQIANRPIQ